MRRRSLAVSAAWAALPWGWFLVRDAHVVLDIVALGLPVIVVVAFATCLALSIRRRRVEPAITALSWLVMGVVAIVGPWSPNAGEAPSSRVRVVAANTYGDHSDADAVERALLARAADVVVLSEPNRALLAPLAARYRSVVSGPASRGSWASDPVLFSSYPATDLGLPPSLAGQRGVRVRVDGPDGPFVVYGLHLLRPRFGPSSDEQVSVRAHARTVERLVAAIESEELPVVVAGDLNLVDRTSGYRLLTKHLDDAVRSGWASPTALRPLGLPFLPRIDHVFVSDGWCSADGGTFALAGSDHRGVAATVGPCLSSDRPARVRRRSRRSPDDPAVRMGEDAGGVEP